MKNTGQTQTKGTLEKKNSKKEIPVIVKRKDNHKDPKGGVYIY